MVLAMSGQTMLRFSVNWKVMASHDSTMAKLF